MIRRIVHSALFRNVGKLLSANVLAQVIGILVYPVLTRIYRPEDFALLNLFVSIAGVLTLIATAEYHYAIVLPKSEQHAKALTHVCLLLLTTLTVLSCFTIFLSRPIAALFKAPQLAQYWWMMPVLVFSMGLWNILNYWYIRRGDYVRISGYQVSQSVFSAGGKVCLGLSGMLQSGMLVATVAAPLLSVVISGVLAWRKHLSVLLKPNMSDMRHVAREYINFPKYNLPRSLVNSLGVALPVWLLTPHFGLSELGQLSLAMTASYMPLSIIARTCYQVLYQRVSEQVRAGQPVGSMLWKFSLLMLMALVVILVPVYMFVPQLVTWFFGAEWLEAAEVIRALYPFIVLTPVCGSICFLSDVFAKQKTALWMEGGYVVAIAIALVVGIHLEDFLLSVSLFAWVRFAYLTIQLVWYTGLVRSYQSSLSVHNS